MIESDRTTATGADHSTSSPINDVANSLREAKSFLTYYLTAQLDKILLVVKNVVVFSMLGLVAALIGITILITATVYLCAGIVRGLEAAFGRFAWAGDLLFGAVVLATVGLGGFIFARRLTGGSKKQLMAAYEKRQRQQRSQFGTDVKQEAHRAGNN